MGDRKQHRKQNTITKTMSRGDCRTYAIVGEGVADGTVPAGVPAGVVAGVLAGVFNGVLAVVGVGVLGVPTSITSQAG